MKNVFRDNFKMWFGNLIQSNGYITPDYSK